MKSQGIRPLLAGLVLLTNNCIATTNFSNQATSTNQVQISQQKNLNLEKDTIQNRLNSLKILLPKLEAAYSRVQESSSEENQKVLTELANKVFSHSDFERHMSKASKLIDKIKASDKNAEYKIKKFQQVVGILKHVPAELEKHKLIFQDLRKTIDSKYHDDCDALIAALDLAIQSSSSQINYIEQLIILLEPM